MRAGEHDLRALGRVPDLHDVRAHAVPGHVPLARDLLPLGQHGLGPAHVQDDRALLDPVHERPHEGALAVLVLREDALALGLAHALEDHLLGRLGGDPAELLHLEVDLDHVLELGARLEPPRLVEAHLELGIGHLLDDALLGEHPDGPGLPVEREAGVVPDTHRPLRGGEEGGLQRLEEDLCRDPLLASDLLDRQLELPVHRGLLDQAEPRGSTSRRALVTRLRGTLRGPSEVSRAKASCATRTSRPESSRWPVHRLPRPDPHETPGGPLELPILAQLAVEPRGRDLQVVAAPDEVRDVDQVPDLVRELLAIADRDASRLVDVEPHRRPPTVAPNLQVDERQAVGLDGRQDGGLDRRLHSRQTSARRHPSPPPCARSLP